jgi:hypothetical protein
MNQVDKAEFDLTLRKVKRAIVVIVAICLVVYLWKSCEASKKLAETQTMNSAMNDSIKTWKDKEGNFKAQIALIQTEKTKYFTEWATSDSTVIALQKLVKQYEKKLSKGGSATIIHTDADIHLSEPTVVTRDSVAPCDPTYTSNFEEYGTGKYKKTKWIWGVVQANKDSVAVGLRFHEEIDVVLGEEKTGFLGLGKAKPFAEVTLHNPFNKVSVLKSYSTTSLPAKRFGIGPVAAYGLGSGVIPQFFVGIGVSWSPIRF